MLSSSDDPGKSHWDAIITSGIVRTAQTSTDLPSKGWAGGEQRMVVGPDGLIEDWRAIAVACGFAGFSADTSFTAIGALYRQDEPGEVASPPGQASVAFLDGKDRTGIGGCDAAISGINHGLAVWASPEFGVGSPPAQVDDSKVRGAWTEDFRTWSQSFTIVDEANDPVGRIQDISLIAAGPGVYVWAGINTDEELWVGLSQNAGRDWEFDLVDTDVRIDFGATSSPNVIVDIAFDSQKEKLYVAYLSDEEDAVMVARADFEPRRAFPDLARLESGLADTAAFAPGDTLFGIDLTESGESSGMGLLGVQWFITILLMVGLGGGLYAVTRNAPLSLSLGSGSALILATIWGLIPVWILLILVLLSAAAVVLWTRSGLGGSSSGGED
jgi:hypothetical protein